MSARESTHHSPQGIPCVDHTQLPCVVERVDAVEGIKVPTAAFLRVILQHINIIEEKCQHSSYLLVVG